MAKKKNLKEAFITDDVRNDISVENAVRQNVERIKDNKAVEIHSRLMVMLDVKSVDDCKYFSIDEFKRLITKTRADKIAKIKAKQEPKEETKPAWERPSNG